MAGARKAGSPLKFAANNAEAHEDEAAEGMSREYQANVQAFALTLIYKDQRRRKTFPWSIYGGHDWFDDGDMETIVARFGEGGLAVRGYRFALLERDLDLGRRSSIREHTTAQVESMLATDGDEPIIVSIETFADFEAMPASLKGDSHENRDARHP